MSNNYMNIGFRLELDPQYWSDSYGIQETDKEKLSVLLHEYIHYLQDTCTYYGALYRKESYDDTVNDTIKGIKKNCSARWLNNYEKTIATTSKSGAIMTMQLFQGS